MNIFETVLTKKFNYLLSSNILFSKESKMTWNIAELKNENSTTHQILGYINSILSAYSIKICCKN